MKEEQVYKTATPQTSLSCSPTPWLVPELQEPPEGAVVHVGSLASAEIAEVGAR